MGFWTLLLGFVSGMMKAVNRILDDLKESKLINQGRALEQADMAKREIDVNRKQTEILSQDRTKDEVVKKMEDGNF